MVDATKVLEAVMWLKSVTPMSYLGPKFLESMDAITDYVDGSRKEYETLYFDLEHKCRVITKMSEHLAWLGWHPISENDLPEAGKRVVVLDGEGKIGVAEKLDGEWWMSEPHYAGLANLAYWMPLPKLPEVANAD